MSAQPDPLRVVASGIGWVTLATGALQVVAPRFVLKKIGGADRDDSVHLFGTIGFFMVIVGGLLVHSLSRPIPNREVVTWGALQKIGATTAMSIGAARGVFSPIALLVAAFDGVSAVLLVVYRRRLTS